MHKFKVQLYITFFLLLLLVACNHNSRQIKYIIEQAKSCMDEYPDSALLLLQDIAFPQILRGKEGQRIFLVGKLSFKRIA